MNCIEFNSVTKKYRDKYALNNVSFSLECNKSYSLIGPNGAGKSTILKIIAGLISPDAGNVSIKGNKPGSDEAKKITGYLAEEALPYINLTVKENLLYIGSLRKVNDLEKRISFLIDLFGLDSYLNSMVSNLSRGTKQRLSLALSIIHNPEIVLLDEPFNYIDIPTQEKIIKYFKTMNSTFLISTHVMSIAENFTENIIMINNGNIIFNGKLSEIEEMKSGNETVESLIARMMS
ncbi:ABC transporter ATP-binding protein [Acidiplasma sp.]|uniref:ABC transporter ATP-binding protein n=1 Tax=Acidiplasma sp. TaxID=1872114 RepID=UPI00316617CE